jgi:phosphoribosyl-ATP pyrophosphohydrolase/phosphoribosyl-AMP cyclohydrolase
LLKVQPDGPACHTGQTSCFFTRLEELPQDYEAAEPGSGVLEELFAVIQDRQRELPEGSYTAQLLQEGVGRIAQKVIEEAGETALAAAQGHQDGLPGEVADLLYHLLVLLAAAGVPPSTVWEELRRRRG